MAELTRPNGQARRQPWSSGEVADPAERQSKMTRAEGGRKGLVSFSFLALFCQTGNTTYKCILHILLALRAACSWDAWRRSAFDDSTSRGIGPNLAVVTPRGTALRRTVIML